MSTFGESGAVRLKHWLCCSAAAMAVFAPQLALAQAAEETGGLEEIVVTAQKREQSLQDVPIAVTAISANALQVNRVVTMNDLSGLAPNTTVRSTAGSSSQVAVSMRGIQALGSAAGQDKEVSYNLDGVYMGNARGTAFELPDIARIEVLRGPQGTLFGRNATAGAISIITRDPKGEFGVKQDITVGNYDQLRLRTSIDLPAVGPFTAYVTYVHNQRRGDIKNLGAGTRWDRTSPNGKLGVQYSPTWLGSRNAESVFAAVKFEPSDTFQTTYKFDFSEDHFTPEGVGVAAINPNALSVGPVIAALVNNQPVGGGPWGPVVFAPSGLRPKEVNNFWSTPGTLRNVGHNVTSTLQLADHLSVKNIFAYRTAFIDAAVSQIGGLGGLIVTPGAVAAAPSLAPFLGQRWIDTATNNSNNSNQTSDELQLNFDSKLVTLTVGGIWYRGTDVNGSPQDIRTTVGATALPATGEVPLGNISVSTSKIRSLAAYGQAEIHVTPQLDLVLGARVTNDKKSSVLLTGGTFQSSVAGCPVTSNPVGVCRTQGTITGVRADTFTYNKTKPNYLVGVNFKPNNDTLLYAKFSTAYVSGGKLGLEFLPETVKSWEVGAKADFLDHKLRANISLFDAKYKNVQSAQSGRNIQDVSKLPAVVFFTQISAMAITGYDLHAKGIEAELTAAPAEGLTMGASFGYTDLKLSNINPLLYPSVSINGSPPATTYLYLGIPSTTAAGWVQYESRPLFDDVTAFLRLDLNYRSKVRNDGNPDRAVAIPAFKDVALAPEAWILNGRLALRNVKMGPLDMEVGIWGRNLTDYKGAQFPLFVTYEGSTNYQQARTFGLDVSMSF